MTHLKFKPLRKGRLLNEKTANDWKQLLNKMEMDILFNRVPKKIIPRVNEMIDYLRSSLRGKQLTINF